ncbi:MAG: hypothetical protein QXE31_04275 [Candidatus Woesearchaeota archaeon]
METRKIQKTGIATYIVSLPKTWIVKKGLKAGDKVNIIEEKDQSLRICLDYKDPLKKEVEIKLNKDISLEEFLRKFTAHYLDGATKITILINDKKNIFKEITLNLKRFMGYEIVEQSSSKLIIQDFFTSENLSLTKTIRREFNISKMVIEESRGILNKEINNLNNIELWEEEVDKLYLFLRRQINFAIHNSSILKNFEVTLKECQDYLLLIDAIEKITDSFYTISQNALQIEAISEKSLKRLNTIYDRILESYEIAFSSIFKKSFKDSNTNYEKIKEILNYNITIHEENLNEKSKENLYMILANLHTIINYLEEIAEIGLGVDEEN